MINGYADRIGGAAYNQKLSQRRADAVKTFLAEHGVPAARIHAEGKARLTLSSTARILLLRAKSRHSNS